MSQIVEEFDTAHTMSGLPAPEGWYIEERRYNFGTHVGLMWVRLSGEKISIIEDVTIKDDGKKWLHVSIGRAKSKMPTYEDIQMARRLFIGEHRECYQVFPTQARYVNFDNVLHLWCCLDQPDGVLPHFEKMAISPIDGKEALSV